MHHQIPDMRVEFVNEYFYNNIWRKGVFLREEYGPLCNWIIKSLRRVKVHSVIELGCGNGWLCLELARAGFKVTGLDISKKSIKIAQDYLNSLNEKDELSLNYSCENILDYDRYLGESVVCFGFLHHLPSQALRKVISYMWKKMKAGQLLLVLEPRYEYASYEMSALIYALRLALPNHFKYKNISSDAISHLKEIFDELSEAHKTQSVMDKESSSDMIEKIIKQNFQKSYLLFFC